jgi:hypothetical protein
MGEFEMEKGVDAGTKKATDNGTDHGQDDGFLARWSRRKTLARRDSESPNPAPAPVSAESLEVIPKSADVDTDTDTDAEPERLLTDADMPPLESLGPDSDYSGFLSRGVSEALRRKALARLFRSPAYNVVDGLDDYAEDFTKFAPLGDIVTADMRHQIEQRLKRLADTETDMSASIDDSDAATQVSQVEGEAPDRPDQAEHSEPPKHVCPQAQVGASAAPGRAEHRHAGDTQ